MVVITNSGCTSGCDVNCEYHCRSFGVDKKLFGWKVSQKRYDRIDNALFCRCVWHNLFYLFS